MHSYIIRRLLLMIPVMLVMTAVAFFTIRAIPGSAVDAMIAAGGSDIEIDKDMILRRLGLDQPLLVQYGRWMGVIPQNDGSFSGLFQGDFGVSWWTQRSTIDLIRIRWPITLEVAFLAIIISQLIAVPIGVYSALRQDQVGDYIGRSFAILCISIPGFWLGTMVIVMPSIWWGYMPAFMHIPFAENPIGNLKMFIVPAFVAGMAMSGMTMRMTRTMMLEVLRQDYIRTAWTKGLKERVIVIRHALKNALIPVISIVGLQIPVMIGGTVIIEKIFSLPGMGRLMVDALLQKDEPLLTAMLLFYAAGMVVVNLLVDITYAYLDPRVRYT